MKLHIDKCIPTKERFHPFQKHNNLTPNFVQNLLLDICFLRTELFCQLKGKIYSRQSYFMEWNNGPFGINVEMSSITRETNAPERDSETICNIVLLSKYLMNFFAIIKYHVT